MNKRQRMRRGLIVILVVAGVGLLCPFRLGVVQGSSMLPAIQDGTLCVVDRSYYRFHAIRQGDIVIVKHEGQLLTKRVFAAPGDTVHLIRYTDDGGYQIPGPAELRLLPKLARRGYAARLIRLTLAPDRCFVVGDNRAASYDSRQFGPVETSAIVGRVVGPVAELRRARPASTLRASL